MIKTEFKIPRMDCASEERIIRMRLEGINEVIKLDFDLQKRSLTVVHSNTSQEMLMLLEPLNFGAEIINSEITQEDQLSSKKDNSQDEAKVLKILLAINGTMFLVELFYGLIADSMGLLADSLDMLADASVYAVSLFAVGKALSAKKNSAILNGRLQIILGICVLVETVRKFVFGSDPEPSYMMIISFVALVANIFCLWLISRHKEGGVHMKASYICASTDVLANVGVILAGVLVSLTSSAVPDLFIGVIVTFIILRGGVSILRIAG
jgi:Co/Zn/Cd efflux system component